MIWYWFPLKGLVTLFSIHIFIFRFEQSWFIIHRKNKRAGPRYATINRCSAEKLRFIRGSCHLSRCKFPKTINRADLQETLKTVAYGKKTMPFLSLLVFHRFLIQEWWKAAKRLDSLTQVSPLFNIVWLSLYFYMAHDLCFGWFISLPRSSAFRICLLQAVCVLDQPASIHSFHRMLVVKLWNGIVQ